jgi:hypothetical protein
MEDNNRRNGRWSLNGHQRIRYMADARNKALAPLETTDALDGRRFSKLVFLNDVYFDWRM